jgi:hypothetical protein
MLSKITLATVIIMIGVTKSATWQGSGNIFCESDCENYKGEWTAWSPEYVNIEGVSTYKNCSSSN